ncbi:MAG TPA: FAD-dependent oxidoreductase [Candidatus Acidoferrales bacterium]|nr:FAD-dependent oxidoreductase [Candidatus Acidoferrales bacterium]
MAKIFDVAVVGAGVFGAWTALELERRGASVLLVDAYGPGNSRSSSGGESRIIRCGYGPDEIYSRWALESLSAWREFFAEIGQALFYPTGVLWLTQPDEPHARATLATFEKLGIRHEWLTAGQVRQRWPQIALEPREEAIFEPSSGGLAARRAVQAVAAEFVRRGGEFRQDQVLPPSPSGRLDQIAFASGDSLSADQFVFACGSWLGKLFPNLVAPLLFPSRQEVFFFGVPAGDRRFSPPLLPIWLRLSDETYGFPDLDGRGVKIASDHHGPPLDPDTVERLPAAEALAVARAALGRVLPALGGAPLVEARVCQYENTSNGDFLIDRHPEWMNVWLAGGGSGHGFKHGPAMGRYLTRLVLEGGEPDPRFSLATKASVQSRTVR